MALRRVLTLTVIGVVTLIAIAALAIGPTTAHPGGLLSSSAHAMVDAATDGWEAPMHDDAPMPMHGSGAHTMSGEDHDAMHERMREDMPAEAREACDERHAAHVDGEQ